MNTVPKFEIVEGQYLQEILLQTCRIPPEHGNLKSLTPSNDPQKHCVWYISLKFVSRKIKRDINMVLGMSRVFWGIFLTASLKHLQFSVAFGLFFGDFLAFRRPLFDCFHLAHACGISLCEQNLETGLLQAKKN